MTKSLIVGCKSNSILTIHKEVGFETAIRERLYFDTIETDSSSHIETYYVVDSSWKFSWFVGECNKFANYRTEVVAANAEANEEDYYEVGSPDATDYTFEVSDPEMDRRRVIRVEVDAPNPDEAARLRALEIYGGMDDDIDIPETRCLIVTRDDSVWKIKVTLFSDRKTVVTPIEFLESSCGDAIRPPRNFLEQVLGKPSASYVPNALFDAVDDGDHVPISIGFYEDHIDYFNVVFE